MRILRLCSCRSLRPGGRRSCCCWRWWGCHTGPVKIGEVLRVVSHKEFRSLENLHFQGLATNLQVVLFFNSSFFSIFPFDLIWLFFSSRLQSDLVDHLNPRIPIKTYSSVWRKKNWRKLFFWIIRLNCWSGDKNNHWSCNRKTGRRRFQFMFW